MLALIRICITAISYRQCFQLVLVLFGCMQMNTHYVPLMNYYINWYCPKSDFFAERLIILFLDFGRSTIKRSLSDGNILCETDSKTDHLNIKIRQIYRGIASQVVLEAQKEASAAAMTVKCLRYIEFFFHLNFDTHLSAICCDINKRNKTTTQPIFRNLHISS